jgi:Ca2+-binding EF-hand superfamily protein
MGAEITKLIHSEELEDYAQHGFSDMQLDIISAKFKETCYPEKEMNPNKFAKLCKISSKMIRPIFENIDMDGDGLLDEYEFVCALAIVYKADLDQKIVALYSVFDADQSNVLDKSEFTNLLGCIMMAAKDGTPQTNEQIQAKFDEVWADNKIHGDSLHLAEFKKVVCRDPEFRLGLTNMGFLLPEEICPNGENYDEDIAEEMELEDGEGHGEEFQARKAGIESVNPGTADQGGLFAQEQVDGGDQFMAVKPWKGAIRPPTDYKFNSGDDNAPDAELMLEFVHGYRCHDVRNNIGYCEDGDDILFHTAAVGIIHNVKENTQKYIFENSDDIISMDTRGGMSCTGEIGPKPIISLWNNET